MAGEEKKQAESSQYIKELQIAHIGSILEGLQNKSNSSKNNHDIKPDTTNTESTELSYEDGVLFYFQFLEFMLTRIKKLQELLTSDYKKFVTQRVTTQNEDTSKNLNDMDNSLNKIKNLRSLQNYLVKQIYALRKSISDLSIKNRELGKIAKEIVRQSNDVLKNLALEQSRITELETMLTRDYTTLSRKNFPRSPASLSDFFGKSVLVLDDDDDALEKPKEAISTTTEEDFHQFT
ncbi:MAG TPA: hypothetical protein VG895_00220 [Patescibacteria group bacterium]|nr:hypothetical protein [Gammaproteobacteria bacterium]HWA51467.1 hypothetical protein [Patescibacteria group bacterium]